MTEHITGIVQILNVRKPEKFIHIVHLRRRNEMHTTVILDGKVFACNLSSNQIIAINKSHPPLKLKLFRNINDVEKLLTFDLATLNNSTFSTVTNVPSNEIVIPNESSVTRNKNTPIGSNIEPSSFSTAGVTNVPLTEVLYLSFGSFDAFFENISWIKGETLSTFRNYLSINLNKTRTKSSVSTTRRT